MKELESIKKPHQVKEISQDEKRYQIDLDERITPHRGHKLFKVDMNSGDIFEAEYASDLVWDKNKQTFVPENAELIKERGYKYVSALNKQNVKKKLKKQSNGSRIDWKSDKIDPKIF